MSAREVDLPAGWLSAPLSDLGTWSGGGTPSKAHSSFWKDGSIPWVSPKDMKVERIHDSEDHITEEAVRGSATKLIPSGSVLFVTRSGILAHTFPVAVTTVDVTVNQDLKAVTPHLGLSPDYVAWGARALGGQILRRCSRDGTTVASIDTGRLMGFELPVAPLPEQHRIVEALESCLTRLDDAVATLKRVQRNLKRYRASVLKAAVEGRLVPTEAELARAEARDYEPASVLLGRIVADRRLRRQEAGGRSKYEEPVAPDTTDLPELPEGWCWATVGMLADVGTGATPKRGDHRYWSNGSVPWVTSAVAGYEIVTQPSAFVSEAALRETNLTLYPPGTLVVAMYGEGKTRGQCAELAIETTTNQALAALVTAGTGVEVRPWLKLFMAHNYDNIRRRASGGVQPNLNLGMIRDIAVPFPPLAEQARITTEIGATLSVASQVGSDVVAHERKASRLRQSILKWAFEGKLADQDPRDEPASVLLERTRTETVARATSAPTGVPPKRRGRTGTMARAKHTK